MPTDSIDPLVTEFVDEYIECFADWDVLVYFFENQEIVRKPSGVALDVARERNSIVRCLETLREKGVLVLEESGGGEPGYRFAADEGFRKGMEAFNRCIDERAKRLAVVSMVLQKEANSA